MNDDTIVTTRDRKKVLEWMSAGRDVQYHYLNHKPNNWYKVANAADTGSIYFPPTTDEIEYGLVPTTVRYFYVVVHVDGWACKFDSVDQARSYVRRISAGDNPANCLVFNKVTWKDDKVTDRYSHLMEIV